MYDSFFRFILLLLGDININSSPNTVYNNKIPLNTHQFYNRNEPTVPFKCIVVTVAKNRTIQKGIFSKKGACFDNCFKCFDNWN